MPVTVTKYRCLGPQIDRGLRPRGVARREAPQLPISFERQGQMPASHPHRPVELLQTLQVEVLLAPKLAKRGEQRVLIGEVRRQGLRDREDARHGHHTGSGA